MSIEDPIDTVAAAEATAPAESGSESAKRQQILEGARRVFLRSGFAAASMGEIAREAKVSKGTLYVYFDSKEALFAALIEDSKRETAERLLGLDPTSTDVRAFLTLLANRLIEKLASPSHVAMVRMVIGAAEQFPDLARAFYEAGAGHGRERLAQWFRLQVDAGRLDVPDPDIAAWIFLGMCCHPVMVHVVLAALPMPDAARIEAYADEVVATFLARYAPPSGMSSGT